MVQKQLAFRQKGKNRYSSVSIFSSKIKCGNCGSWYGSKVWHSNSKYRRVIWQCNHKFSGDEKCSTPHLDEEEIKELFIKAVNLLVYDKDHIIENFYLIKDKLFATSALEHEQAELESEINIVAGMLQECINENARIAQDQREYEKRYNDFVDRFEKAKSRHTEVKDLIIDNQARREQIEIFLKELKKTDLIISFDESVWHSLVAFITVVSKDDIKVTFKDGTEVKI